MAGLPLIHQAHIAVDITNIEVLNLHTARATSHDCECPHHGTEQCDCQMSVLLVYGNMQASAALMLHGNNGTTWLSVTGYARADTRLADQIRATLSIACELSLQPLRRRIKPPIRSSLLIETTTWLSSLEKP